MIKSLYAYSLKHSALIVKRSSIMAWRFGRRKCIGMQSEELLQQIGMKEPSEHIIGR